MSQFNYTVTILPNADVGQIMRSDGKCVLWSDADFQAWNAAQLPPFAPSARQQLTSRIRAMTLAQWKDGTTLTADQKDTIAFFAAKLAFSQEIV